MGNRNFADERVNETGKTGAPKAQAAIRDGKGGKHELLLLNLRDWGRKKGEEVEPVGVKYEPQKYSCVNECTCFQHNSSRNVNLIPFS